MNPSTPNTEYSPTPYSQTQASAAMADGNSHAPQIKWIQPTLRQETVEIVATKATSFRTFINASERVVSIIGGFSQTSSRIDEIIENCDFLENTTSDSSQLKKFIHKSHIKPSDIRNHLNEAAKYMQISSAKLKLINDHSTNEKLFYIDFKLDEDEISASEQFDNYILAYLADIDLSVSKINISIS